MEDEMSQGIAQERRERVIRILLSIARRTISTVELLQHGDAETALGFAYCGEMEFRDCARILRGDPDLPERGVILDRLESLAPS